ncbi:aldehyde dehydrogenase [Cupriavidus necator]|uniref:aldehyde dehydrogenase n=1 Tax=Cupriavidus necator TaxID=106590 RepID=UPI0029C25EE2|nr:aldehyde dehydrogenase [Cupriavidus necator]MDX6008749.1 aldehyde dehydrogenase [Cupriavidus necator]
MKRYQMFINNEWVDSTSGQWFESIEPYSGKAWAEVPKGNAQDVEKAVQAAKAAFDDPAWRDLTATQRGALLRRLAELVSTNVARLADTEQRDNGKLIAEVSGQVQNVAQWFHYYAGLADKVQGAVVPINKPGVFNYIKHEPLGVVAAITPWNSPLALTVWKMAPALAAGNTMVIKPSEYTSASLLELAALTKEAGFPPGVVNVITGFGADVGEPLVRHQDIAKIAFTGGDIAGQRINEIAASDFKKVTLELGGKSANIVFDDADLDQAVKGAVAGIFGAAGQTCMAGSRLLVQRNVHDQFVEMLIKVASDAVIGDPSKHETQVGPIATEAQFRKILSYIEIAKSGGAHCVLGGHALTGDAYGQGQFIAPTIFTGVTNDMRIAQEEVFGPVLAVIPFDTEDDALRIANDTMFGLAAGVWTSDLHRAFYMSDRLKAGTVWVNNYRATSFTTPFGGYKRSGIGREGGVDAIKEYLQTKSVWITTKPAKANAFVLG